eukprot:356367-Chlamydomonas_euryale.AAC.7
MQARLPLFPVVPFVLKAVKSSESSESVPQPSKIVRYCYLSVPSPWPVKLRVWTTRSPDRSSQGN